MSGHGMVTLDGKPVAALWEGDVRRLRLSADDWERLGLLRGQRVDVALPGRPPAAAFIAADTFTPPAWVWLTLVRQRSAVSTAGR